MAVDWTVDWTVTFRPRPYFVGPLASMLEQPLAPFLLSLNSKTPVELVT